MSKLLAKIQSYKGLVENFSYLTLIQVVNLAVSLAQKGFTAGIMDIDLHGPDTLMMLGLEGRKNTTGENGIEPLLFEPLKLKVISIASFIDRAETALIWRGPLKIGVIKQFVTDVEWGDLDYLIIDSPPGTGQDRHWKP